MEPTSEDAKNAESMFVYRMNQMGVPIQEGESVMDFINRNGFPFHITYYEERQDN